MRSERFDQAVADAISTTSDECMTLPWRRQGIRPIGSKGRTVARIVWETANGPVPDGLWVLHTCDNEECVSLRHLYVGDRSRNVRDYYERHGRFWWQEIVRCPFNHPYDEANTYVDKRGRRTCKTCQQRRSREYQARRRATR